MEATLTLGRARQALERAWPALRADKLHGLTALVRLANQRYTTYGIGQAAVLAPLVEVIYDHQPDLSEVYHRDLDEDIDKLILAWLRGLLVAQAGADLLRSRVRDVLLEVPPDRATDFVIEALALLDADLDNRVADYLSGLAERRPAFLHPAVESIMATRSLAQRNPALLAVLTEAYYIERPDPDDPWWSGYGSLDDGVRRHHHAGAGLGNPMAGSYHGPFWNLLTADPRLALRTINRILDHGAQVRMGKASRWVGAADLDDQDAGLDLDLLGRGSTACVGDTHVWAWYRGSSGGPYPCMSALLAVKRLADQLLGRGLSLQRVSELLVADCHNLAMPGLVVGLLVRHLDNVTNELDRWLCRAEVWSLEFSRAVSEGHLHIQGADADDLPGNGQRRYTFRETAGYLVATAITSGNDARLDALAKCGRELMRRARAAVLPDIDPDDPGHDTDNERLVSIAGWAAHLDRDNYVLVELPDGRVGVQYQPPAYLVAAMEAGAADLAHGNRAYGLYNIYALDEDRGAVPDTLHDDLAMARDLAADPPQHGPLYPEDAPAAMAAAGVLAHARGAATLSADELAWAARFLVKCASEPRLGDFDYEQSTFLTGADRSAAAAVPAMLLPALRTEPAHLPDEEVTAALVACTTSLFDEVRRIAATALGPVWQAPCATTDGDGRCIHAIALDAIDAGVRDCQLGPWNQAGRRDRLPISGPLPESLAVVATDSLMISTLVAPIIACADAATSGCCVAATAQTLLDALLDAHRRGAILWADEGYSWNVSDHHYQPARVLYRLAAAGDIEPLLGHVHAFAGHAAALSQLLHDLAQVATHDAALRAALPQVWPAVLRAALDDIDAGADLRGDHHHCDDALANLLPRPELEIGDRDPDATLVAADAGWIDPNLLADLVDRWVPLARGEPRCVDAAVRLARTAPRSWQATVGLRWVTDLIDNRYDRIASHSWFLPDWLQELRAAGQLDAAGRRTVQRILDGLATHGDDRAVRMQRADE